VEPTSEEDGLLLQKKLMDDVSEARPLAKLQEQLEESEVVATEETKKDGPTAGNETEKTTEKVESKPEMTGHEVQHPRKPLLNNIDNELDRLSRVSPYCFILFARLIE
jgi:RNA polymerase II subunit A-like phosphatase